MINDREFPAYLIAFPFYEFDLILGMDWLYKNRIIFDCDKRSIVLKCPNQTKRIVYGIRAGPLSNVISAMQARRFLRK